MTTAEVNVVVGVEAEAAPLVGVELVWAAACEVDCCAADDWVVDDCAGCCCCCDVDEAAGVLLVDAACCVDDSAGLAEGAAAAGEELTEAVAWRGRRTSRACGGGSLGNARVDVRRPARMRLIPENRAVKPARMVERR